MFVIIATMEKPTSQKHEKQFRNKNRFCVFVFSFLISTFLNLQFNLFFFSFDFFSTFFRFYKNTNAHTQLNELEELEE